jgi:Tim44-like domain
MRVLPALALVLLLLTAGPALAQVDNLDSEHQTQGYGRIFAYVCSVAAALTLIIVGIHVVRGMVDEGKRGKKPGWMPERILDTMPKKKADPLYLGEKVPEWKLSNRKPATAAALKYISRKDDWFDPEHMTGVVDKAFRKVKTALEERSTKLIERIVTADCLEELRSQMQRLRKKGHVHHFGKVEITDIEVVHFEAPAAKAKHNFTALISVRSKDYLQDEKSGEVLKGDKKIYIYQEFYVFRRSNERWLVERIRSSEDMDRVLEPKNVLVQAELDKFAKKAEPEHLREFVGQ